MKNVYVYSTKFSEGAKNLARALGSKRLRLERSKFRGKLEKVVVNWGASTLPREVEKCSIVNRPDSVKTASNKATFFELLTREELAHLAPTYTRNRREAEGWFDRRGSKVVCRTLLRASGGAGIIISKSAAELVDAPLYVKYVRKKSEYRVHIGPWVDRGGLEPFRTKVFDVQKKVARRGCEPDDWLVRNYAAGFIYQRENIAPPPTVFTSAMDAFNTTGLHFGAVDVIWSEKRQRAYVLEVNTGPGLQGQTIHSYEQMIRDYVEEMR